MTTSKDKMYFMSTHNFHELLESFQRIKMKHVLILQIYSINRIVQE